MVDEVKADFYREERMIVELLYTNILLATVFGLITFIVKMKAKHKKELEHIVNKYWDIEEELFQCKLNELEKENDE